MNLEDLQNAISVLYNPQTHSVQDKQQAQQYCDTFTQQNASNLKDFFLLFIQSTNQQTQFWLLQAICEIIAKYYQQVMITPEQRQEIHQIYMHILVNNPELVLTQKYYLNKYALIFVLLLKHDFPMYWENAFKELLSLLSQTQDATLQQNLMTLYVKILLTFEEEFVERQEQKSGDQFEISSRVKDAIRIVAINDLVFLLQQCLSSFQAFKQDLINDALQATATLIDWNSLELFTPMIDLFKGLLSKKVFQKNALKCLFAIVHKGMDYPQKIEVICGLQFMDVLESFKMQYPERTEQDYDKQQEEEEFFEVIADIVNKLGQWCLELYGNETKMLSSEQHQQEYAKIFNRVLQLSLYLLNTDKPKIGRPVIEFLQFFLQPFKKADEVTEYQGAIFQEIIRIVINRIKYPSWCTFNSENDLSEFEEDYQVYREKSLQGLYLNLALIKAFHQPLIALVNQLFQTVVPGQTPANEAEVPLFLAYHLFQSIPSYMKEKIDNVYYSLMMNIINIDFLAYQHKIVILMVLENIVRYSPYFMQSPVPKENFITIFFSNKVIESKDPQIAARGCYLFLRFCERNTQQFSDQAQNIIKATMEIIQKIEQGVIKNELLGMDECNYLYNIMGIFVSLKVVDHDYRREVVTSVLEHLILKLEGCQPHEKDKIQCFLKYINVFTKGFQSEISAQMKEIFAKVLQILMQILKNNMNHNFMCEQILLYLQRNINILEVQVKPFIMEIILPYIQTVQFERLETIINLMNYALAELKNNMIDIVEHIFDALFKRMYDTPIPFGDTSDVEKVQIRQFQLFFKFLSTSIEVNSTFLTSAKNFPLFQTLIDFLNAHFERNIDRACKKHISVSFKEMFVDFSGLYQDSESLQQYGKKIVVDPNVNKSFIGIYNEQFAYMSEKLLLLVSNYPFILNPKELDDQQIIFVLIDIQSLYVKAGWQDQLIQALKFRSIDESFIQTIIQLCQAIASQKTQLRQFHESYINQMNQWKAQKTAQI